VCVRGDLLSFLAGVLVGPPHPFASAIKCHQKSTSNSAGSSVGSLAHTPGHPTAGWCGRVVSVLPLLLCTRPARARLSVGGQSPPPVLRASSLAPVESSPGLVLSSTVTGDFRAVGSLSHLAPNRDSRLDYVLLRSPGAAVVEPRYALWGRAMHPGPCM
jgi:hypothetical protein